MIARGILFLFVIIGLIQCSPSADKDNPRVNLDHILSLVDSLVIDGRTIAFVRIYAEAPSYRPVEAAGEGIACVDDAGRFMEVLEEEILNNGKKDLLPVFIGLTRFLLYMEREDGLWRNFIYADGSINRTHRNSRAEFGWWAIRGFRGLAAAYRVFRNHTPESSILADIRPGIGLSLEQLLNSIKNSSSGLIKEAPDITSECLLALTRLQETGDFNLLPLIRKMSDALLRRQIDDPSLSVNGMYFCWDSLWHNWGNNQSLALLKTFALSGDSTYLYSVCRWADSFIPYLINNRFPNEVRVSANGGIKTKPFPQIAYGFDSIYRGLAELYHLTGEEMYGKRAKAVFSWFTGSNIIDEPMYDEKTGRCFDGISSAEKLNRNSGAESTIEALLALQAHRKYMR